MPTFGDFETIGEPIAITEQTGHVSTVWRARKSGRDTDPTHAIKCFAPHRRKVGEGEAEDALDKDRGLEFLEGIKQLKKAHAEGGRCLSPIHAFGFADEGAWYVTDFYPRNTLKAWIARRGSVDGAALGQVVQCIVTACLALKRSRGYSHGNLKAANVFLVGKPRPLRKTPLELADAYPAAPLQLARLTGDEKLTVDSLLYQVMEVQDLRALGELLLQLVEGRLVSSAYDYNYPIAASPAWERLGRDAERWRGLCNRLLDPQLSLGKLSLESLAKEYRPGVATKKLPLILGAAAAAVILAGGIFLVAGMISKAGRQKFAIHFQAATNAFAASDWPLAQREIDLALQRNATDPAAREWKKNIGLRLNQDYAAANRAGREALKTNLDEAAKWVKRAKELIPDGQDALDLQRQIGALTAQRELQKSQQQRQIELDAKYATALKAGQVAFEQKDFRLAFDKATEALSYKAGDSVATKLKNDADGQMQSAADRDKKYAAALKAGQTAYAEKDFKLASDKADEALSYKAGDSVATRLKNDADTQLKSAAERDAKYAAALKAGQTAFEKEEFQLASDKATEALSYKAGDAVATKLKNDADGRMKSTADRDAKYAAALKAGQTAFERSEFQLASDKATEALSYKAGDPVATKLKNDAQGQMQAAAARDTKYAAALKAGQTAFDQKDFKLASDKASEALSYKAGDPVATRLKSDADGQIKSAADRDAKYEAALKAGQTAFEQKDFKLASDKAGEALSYKAGDSVATKLKNDADGQLKSASERDAKYAAALQEGQAALDRKDYAAAKTSADLALGFRANDPTATKLKNEAELQLKEVERQVAEKARGQNYQSALTAATKALAEAKAATNYTLLNEKIKMALTQCAIARTNGDAGPIDRLTQELESLQVKAEAAKADNDYARAENLRQLGKIQDALAICQDYPSNAKFVDLKKSLTEMQNAYTSAAASLAKGDYLFVKMLESKGYDKNPLFEPLVTTGASEIKQLAALESLKDPPKWKELSNDLAALKSQFPDTWKKDSFQALVKWVNENDPTRLLDVEILALKIKLGVDRKTVLNDAAGNRITRLPTTADVGSYYDFVDDIIKRLGGENSAAYKARKKDFDDIRSAINNWR